LHLADTSKGSASMFSQKRFIMRFKKGQDVAFLCSETFPHSWKIAKYDNQNEFGCHTVNYANRLIAVRQKDVVRFDPCSDQRVSDFFTHNVNNLIAQLSDVVNTFNLTKVIGTIELQDNTIMLLDGAITIQADKKQVPSIGVIREFPCWTVVGWESISGYDGPPDVSDNFIGDSRTNSGAVVIAIKAAIENCVTGYLQAYLQATSVSDKIDCT